MATIEDGQKSLYSSIALALQSSLSADEAASQVFETGRWTQLQPDFRNHAIISCCLKKHLLDFLDSRLSASASVFNTAPGDNGRTGARTLLVLLKIAFRFYKLAEKFGVKPGDEPSSSISSLMRAIPFEMLQDIVNVTPIDEVPECVEVLYEAMSGIERVSGVACLGPFAHACSLLRSKVVGSEGEEQLGKIMRWMFKHFPDGYKPALNVAHNVNLTHPVNITTISDSALDSLGNPIDKEQYTNFWSLQHSLYDASVLYDGDKWGQCMQQIESVLKACSGPTQVEGSAALKTASEGTVAYLSSPSLLTLQLQDVTFRRQQLVQIVMLLHYSQTCTAISNRASKLRPPLPKIHEDCVKLQERVLELLKVTGSDGAAFDGWLPARQWYVEVTYKYFAVGLRNALQLEAADLQRKAELTQPKQKASAAKEDVSADKKERSCMDTLDLTIKQCGKPWEPADWPMLAYDATLVPEGLNVKGEIHGTFPGEPLAGLEQEPLQDKVKKDMKTIVMEMGKPEEEKRISDPMFQWRTLRMLARSNLKIYSDCITERDADLQYAACVFLKDEDDGELKTKAKRYLDSLPPTLRERKKEARREKAQKKHGAEGTRKRPGHESDSGNASHGTPAKKARTEAQAPSKRGNGEEHPAAPSTAASPLSTRSAGEIPATDAAPNPSGRTSERAKDVVREPVSREAVRAAKRDASEKMQEVTRAAPRDARDDSGRHTHADVSRPSQRPADGNAKAGRDDDAHGGGRERKAPTARGAGDRHGADERGGQAAKGNGTDPMPSGQLGERSRSDGGGLPGPPPMAVRTRDSHPRAPLIAPPQRSSRMPEGRIVRDRDDGDGDTGGGGASRDGQRGGGGPDPGDRTGRGAVPESRRTRDGTGGMRGDQGNSDRDTDRGGASARSGMGSKDGPRTGGRLLGDALNKATGDGPRDTTTSTRRGGASARGSPPGTKHQDYGREKLGALDNGTRGSKTLRSDARVDTSGFAANSSIGGRPAAGLPRYDRSGSRKK